MSPISKGLAGFAVAASLSSPAGAQGIVTQKNITLALAQTIANAALTVPLRLEECLRIAFRRDS